MLESKTEKAMTVSSCVDFKILMCLYLFLSHLHVASALFDVC